MSFTILTTGLSWYDKLVEKYLKVSSLVGVRSLMPSLICWDICQQLLA